MKPCPKFPDKVQIYSTREAERFAARRSWEHGKHTTPYYCPRFEGGCGAWHMTTAVPLLADQFNHTESEDEGDVSP